MKFEMMKKIAMLTVLMLVFVCAYAVAEEIVEVEPAFVPSVVAVEEKADEIPAIIEITDYAVPMSDGLAVTSKGLEGDVIPAIMPELGSIENCSVTIQSNASSRVFIGDQITLTGNIQGLDGVAYTTQWQYQDENGNWQCIEGANGLSYTINVNDENIDYSWRLSVNV